MGARRRGPVWVYVLVSVLVVAGIAAGIRVAIMFQTVGLTGVMRTQFVTVASETCRTKVQAQKNNALSESTVTTYCTCYANHMADNLSPSEVAAIAINGALSPAYKDQIQQATAECTASMASR